MYTVIVGCGRFGSRLAGQLSAEGHEVVIIDKNDDSFASLPPEFSGFEITGNALEQEVLKKAKVDSADLFIATTSSDKNNYMVAQMVRKRYEKPDIIARVIDPDLKKLYSDDDINVFCETSVFVDNIFQEIIFGQEEK